MNVKLDLLNFIHRFKVIVNVNFNYIIIGENDYVFVFNNYKTSGSIGQVVYHVESDTLTSLLDLFFSNYNDTFNYFLTNANGVEISQSNFTHALGSVSKRILGKEIRLNDIRRSLKFQ